MLNALAYCVMKDWHGIVIALNALSNVIFPEAQ